DRTYFPILRITAEVCLKLFFLYDMILVFLILKMKHLQLIQIKFSFPLLEHVCAASYVNTEFMTFWQFYLIEAFIPATNKVKIQMKPDIHSFFLRKSMLCQ